MSEQLDGNGRRIYIHERSLGLLAEDNPVFGSLASIALSRVRVAKIAYHHLSLAEEIGADVRPEVTDRYAGSIRETSRDLLEPLLQTTRYRPRLPYRPEASLPVLAPGEAIEDTCFQDGYYTFATSAAAAGRMFDDRLPMRQLRGRVSLGQEPDLTIISGNSLTHSSRGRAMYAAEVGARRYDQDARELFLDMLQDRANWPHDMATVTPTSDEELVITNFIHAAGVVLERANF